MDLYRDASSAILQLDNQRLNFTYSRSHVPLRKPEFNFWFSQESNSRLPHYFSINRCTVRGYLLDHSITPATSGVVAEDRVNSIMSGRNPPFSMQATQTEAIGF